MSDTPTALVKPDTGEIIESSPIPMPLSPAPGMAPITQEESARLQAPVDENDIDILPTGECYLSQIGYRRRLNGIIGPGQWAMLPLGDPRIQGNTIIQAWALWIRGHQVAQTMGEAEYQPTSDRMTWATAWEAQKSNALMRLCKDIGIASECWDRRWTEAWKAKYATQVWRMGKTKPQWRRLDAIPWFDERGQTLPAAAPSDEARSADTVPPAPAKGKTHPKADAPITEKQRKRLWAILYDRAKQLGIQKKELETAFHAWLQQHYQIDTTEAITIGTYEGIIAALEHWGEDQERIF